MGGGVGVAAHDHHARLGEAQLGADHVHDSLQWRPEIEQLQPEVPRVYRQRLELPRGNRIGDRRRAVPRGDVVVHRRHRQRRPAHPAPRLPQPLERLGRGHLVNQVQVHVFGTRASGIGGLVRAPGPEPGTPSRLPLFRPGHHGAQFGADLLDGMLRTRLAQCIEPPAPAAGLGDPLAREAAGLDVGQDTLHRGPHFLRHDLRAPGVVAVFGGVADRVPHELHPAAIHQVHDQLQLMHALEIGDLRRVSRGRERFEAGLDQRGDTAAQDGLLAEQVSLRLLAERRLEHARTGAPDPGGIGERIGQRVAARVLMHRGRRPHRPGARSRGNGC